MEWSPQRVSEKQSNFTDYATLLGTQKRNDPPEQGQEDRQGKPAVKKQRETVANAPEILKN